MNRFTIEIYTHKGAVINYYDWQAGEDLPAYQFIHCTFSDAFGAFGNTLRCEHMLAVL